MTLYFIKTSQSFLETPAFVYSPPLAIPPNVLKCRLLCTFNYSFDGNNTTFVYLKLATRNCNSRQASSPGGWGLGKCIWKYRKNARKAGSWRARNWTTFKWAKKFVALKLRVLGSPPPTYFFNLFFPQRVPHQFALDPFSFDGAH